MRGEYINRLQSITRYLAAMLLKSRWLLLATLSFVTIMLELQEHKDANLSIDAHLIREVIIYGIVYPVAVGILINVLHKLRSKRETTAHQHELERKRVARHLHDTLGQNLAYLRLMLEKMRMNSALHGIDTIQQELEQMQDAADEAHEQLRITLDMLKSDDAIQLTDLLAAQAQELAKETGIMLNYDVAGEPFAVPFTVQRKIQAIFREALQNIRQHAQANAMQLSVNWEEESLTIAMVDDGVGFELDQLMPQGHFGLLIMRQRAEEVGGEFGITSRPGEGTRVELKWIPK